MNIPGIRKFFTEAARFVINRPALSVAVAAPWAPVGIGVMVAGFPVAGALVIAGSFGSCAGVAYAAYRNLQKERKGPDIGQP